MLRQSLLPAALTVLTFALACGDGPGIIDHPDYSSFYDFSSVTDTFTGSDTAIDRDDFEPGDASTVEDAADAQGQDIQASDSSGDTVDVDLQDVGDAPDEGNGGGDIAFDEFTETGSDTASDDGADDASDSMAVDIGPDFGTGDYTGIYEGMDDMTGVPLAQALGKLVRTGTTTVTYDDAKDILREDIDLYDGDIQEIYTGQWWDPDASIINVEHTWPQSKGAGSAPAQGDMHHLYLAHAYYNSARSNYPYGNVVNITYDGNDVAPFPDEDCTDRFSTSDWTGCMTYVGYDSQDERVCEPRDAHKGNVARAVFYFQLRYGGSNYSLKPLSDFDTYGTAHVGLTESTLKDWNRLDPPDDHERDRNTRIAAHEGVRNPFIDHPEFVDRIDFTP